MNTKYEVRLYAANQKGKRTLVESRGFNNESVARYHEKTLNEYAASSKYFNSMYTDAEVKVVENKHWTPSKYAVNFEWSKEDGKYIR